MQNFSDAVSMHNGNIYTVGGTVQAAGGAYLERSVDRELLSKCLGGTFSFVLSARQMGKSSVMVRTAEVLADHGVKSVIVDLSQIGVQVSAEEWYFGFLSKVEDSLTLETDLLEWWEDRVQIGLGQKLITFFEEVVLAETHESLVIFVDEIDSTLSMPFTDDFFAAIRYAYNTRSTIPAFKRLSFVLIGVATPNDLISDPSRTPFNIGEQVEVQYFSREEAQPFAAGFDLPEAKAREVLDWILEWTSGHPYLTQRLCSVVARQDKNNLTRSDINTLTKETFFGEQSEQDSNLRFVHDMLVRRTEERVEVLSTYMKVLTGRKIQDDRQSYPITHLKLSGIISRKNGSLDISTEIYRSVFDRDWLKRQWPEHWLKRVPPAVLGLVAASFIAVIALGLFTLQYQQARRAEFARLTQEQNNTQLQTQITQVESLSKTVSEEKEKVDSLLAGAQHSNVLLTNAVKTANEAERATTAANQQLNSEIARSNSLRLQAEDLNEQLSTSAVISDSLAVVAEIRADQATQARTETLILALADASRRQVRIGDASLAAELARQALIFSEQGDGTYLDPVYAALVASLNSLTPAGTSPYGGPVPFGDFNSAVRIAAVSHDGDLYAVGLEDGTIGFGHINEPSERSSDYVKKHSGAVRGLIFHPSEPLLLSAGDDGKVLLWSNFGQDSVTPFARTIEERDVPVWAAGFSNDGKHIVVAGTDNLITVRETPSNQIVNTFTLQEAGRITVMATAPAGNLMAFGSEDGQIILWDEISTTPIRWGASQGRIRALAFGGGGSYLVSGGDSTFVQQWMFDGPGAAGVAGLTLRGHEGPVNSLSFDQTGTRLASGSADHSIQIWDMMNPEQNSIILEGHDAWVWSVALDDSGSRLISGGADRRVNIWNVDSDELASRICKISSGRVLSPAEWNRYIGADFDYAESYSSCGGHDSVSETTIGSSTTGEN